MKKISIMLLAIAMLFAFVACENDGVDITSETVTTVDTFKTALSNEEVDKIVISGNIALTEALVSERDGLIISGDGTVDLSDFALWINGDKTQIEGVTFITSSAHNTLSIYGQNPIVKGVHFKSEEGTSSAAYGVKFNWTDNALLENCTFDDLRIPFYFAEFDNASSGARMTTATAKNNTVTNCMKVDLETADVVDLTDNTFDLTNGITIMDKTVAEDAAEVIKGISDANGGVKVTWGENVYPTEG